MWISVHIHAFVGSDSGHNLHFNFNNLNFADF
jgi:hypothetical protein